MAYLEERLSLRKVLYIYQRRHYHSLLHHCDQKCNRLQIKNLHNFSFPKYMFFHLHPGSYFRLSN